MFKDKMPTHLKIIIYYAGILIPMFLLSACQFGADVSNPPLPTIVPAKDAADSQPTAAVLVQEPSPTPTETQATAPTETPSEVVQDTVPTATSTVAPPTATPAAAAIPVVPLEALSLSLNPVAGGFTKPLFVTHAGDGSGRIFVVEQAGRIFIIQDQIVNPTPFLDIVPLVGSDANEQGLLSAAFHPDYANNGYFFVYYTNKQGDVVIARYQVSNNSDQTDPDSSQILLTIDQPFGNHNGGQLVFGPDGYLYIGLGDGGAANDPQNNGQTLDTLLGKILRLDIDNGQPYGVPEDNPFVTTAGVRPEIWSYGWRNPWRFSFDRATNDMYIADVGQNKFEEVHFEPAGDAGGQNYGWRLMEGFHCFDPAQCDPTSLNLVLPIAEYDHGQGCSISGGYVYRGVKFPALSGVYLYGDFCSGHVWGLRQNTDGAWSEIKLLQTNHRISSFGEDEAGEIYLVDHTGDILEVGLMK